MDFYRAFQEKTQLSFIKYLKTSNHRIDFKKALLLRLRQVCLHPWLVNFSKGDDLHKYLLNEQQLVMNACFQFKQSQIQRILSSLKAAEAMSDKFKCESCHEKEVARIIPGCAHCVCPDCIEDIGEDPTMNADEVSLGYCSVCHLQYERLHITTLIGFQCAWVEGFREDDWDRAEAEQEQLVEDPKAVKKAIFDTLKYHLEANDGFLATTKRIDIDPEVWGASNVNSVEEYWEDGDNLSFVVDDDEEDMGMRDYADTNRGSDDNSDGPDDNDDDSSDCEKKRPNKRTFNWEDLDARKRVRYGSDALEGKY